MFPSNIGTSFPLIKTTFHYVSKRRQNYFFLVSLLGSTKCTRLFPTYLVEVRKTVVDGPIRYLKVNEWVQQGNPIHFLQFSGGTKFLRPNKLSRTNQKHLSPLHIPSRSYKNSGSCFCRISERVFP